MKKSILFFPIAAICLTACGGTYFSTVFDWAYPNYTPSFDDSGRLSMNLQGDAFINDGTKTTTYHVAMFDTGFYVQASFVELIEEVSKNVVVTTLVDFSESGAFIDRTEDGEEIQHLFEPMTLEEIIELSSAVNDWPTIYSEQLQGVLHDSLTDLAIGPATINGDLYSFNLPVGQFMDAAALEELLGAPASNIALLFGFNKVTLEMTIDITADVAEGDYEMDLDFYNPELVVAADYLLSNAEKLGYTNYPVV